jgi:hypothetical protein
MSTYFRPNIHQNGPEILGVKVGTQNHEALEFVRSFHFLDPMNCQASWFWAPTLEVHSQSSFAISKPVEKRKMWKNANCGLSHEGRCLYSFRGQNMALKGFFGGA